MRKKKSYHLDSNGSDLKSISLEKLHLDLDNPRLPNNVVRKESDIIKYIATNTSLEDLMSAISENGFFPGEPLIAIPKEGSADEYVVVEGNRRLTAVKLLNDVTLIDKPSKRLRDIARECSDPPEKLPVVIRKNREDVLPYLGFRHISGVKQWEPLAKARYIKQLFDSSTSPTDDAVKRYAETAKIIGSRRDFIKRNLDALAVYEVMESEDFYGLATLNEETIKFSILSTALADEKIARFVGINNEDSSQSPILNPSILDNDGVREITNWMFKVDDDGNTVLGESRNLRMLARVVDTDKALASLRKGNSLEYAYRLTRGADEEFIQFLYQADEALSNASSLVANVAYDEVAYNLARTMFNNIKLIGTQLKEKKSEDDEF